MKKTEETDGFLSHIFVHFYAQDKDCEQREKEKKHVLTERSKQKVSQKNVTLLSGYSIPGTYLKAIGYMSHFHSGICWCLIKKERGSRNWCLLTWKILWVLCIISFPVGMVNIAMGLKNQTDIQKVLTIFFTKITIILFCVWLLIPWGCTLEQN